MKSALLVLSIYFCVLTAQSQPNTKKGLYVPKKISETIGQKYILLPVDSNENEFDYLLHKWVDNNTELPTVPIGDRGKAIATLKEIVGGNHAKLIGSNDTSYFQYFEDADDRVMRHFALLADYEKAKSFTGKTLWRKSDKAKVIIKAVSLTSDNNAPFKLTYKCANGKMGSVAVVLSGTNSIVTDKNVLFDNQFYIAKP